MRTFDGADMGHHVLLNLYECEDVEGLRDLETFRTFASSMLANARAEVVDTLSHQFLPSGQAGFTYLALLTTSHFSIHTWPEHRAAAVDIFTCGSVSTIRIVDNLISYFDAAHHSVKDVLR